MLSHEYAQKLLALPNLPLSDYCEGTGEPRTDEEVDVNHPDYKPFEGEILISDSDERTPEWLEWYASMPKMKVIVNN